MRAASHRYTLVGAVLLATGLSTAALAGCAASPKPIPSASSTPSATPVFASDEEALAAAEEAYAAYLKVSDEVFRDGGTEPERLEEIAVASALDDLMRDAAEFEEKAIHSTGSTSFRVHSLQSVDDSPIAVTLYVCDDVSEVDLLDSAGASLVSSDRAALTPFIIRLEGDGDQLLVSDREVWTGEGFCN